MTFEVRVDPTNPGQFFACCGLFELAARIDHDARGRFAPRTFVVEGHPSLHDILAPLTTASLATVDEEDKYSSPLRLAAPFDLRLDWWKDMRAGGRNLKVWAGSMEGPRIAQAMLAAVRALELHNDNILNYGCVVYDPAAPAKKVEPFYFDARRAPNAHARDIGFSPNDLDLTTTAFPAVEALCLIGLQRFRPGNGGRRRIFEYRTWANPLSIELSAPVVAGAISIAGTVAYRFECWPRTEYSKAFRPAVAVGEGDGH